MANKQDDLDRAVKFLAKRDGIDKTLKTIRYTSKLIIASSDKQRNLSKRLSALEKSIGNARQIYRLGRFLQEVNAARKLNPDSKDYILDLTICIGQGTYYFAEQIAWLMKIGVIDNTNEYLIKKIVPYFEFASYIAGVILGCMKIRQLKEQEQSLLTKLERARKENDAEEADLAKKLKAQQFAIALKCAGVAQDFAEGIMSWSDIFGDKTVCSNPVLLASCGLFSALVSGYKNWITV